MAGQSYYPAQRDNPAQGVATIPLFKAGGKWLNALNFRFYKGAAFTFFRKASYIVPVAVAQTLSVPSPTCQVNAVRPGIPVVTGGSITVAVGDTVNYQIVATNDPTLYYAAVLPSWLTLNKTTGKITGVVVGPAEEILLGFRATNITGTGTAFFGIIVTL